MLNDQAVCMPVWTNSPCRVQTQAHGVLHVSRGPQRERQCCRQTSHQLRAPDVSWSCIGLDAFRELCPSAQHLLVPCATQHYPSRGSICLKTDRSVGATTSPQQPGSKVLRGPVVLAPLLPFAVHLAAQHPTSHPQNPKLKQEILLKNSAQAPLACVFLRSGGGVVLLSCALLRSSLCSYP